MKHLAILLAIISIATGTLSAQSYKGVLCDTSGNVINELAAIIVLNKKDSSQIYSKYIENGIFGISPDLKGVDSALIYFSVYGYKEKFALLPKDKYDLGKIVLDHSLNIIDSVVVTATPSISFKMMRGKEHFDIPEVVTQSQYDLNSLLGEIPGLSYNGNSVEIVGKGSPVYLINGFKPRPGELSTIQPEDVDKVVVDKWPSAKYNKSVKGIINIITKERKHDYLNGYIADELNVCKYANNSATVSLNNKLGRWVNFFQYRHKYNHTSAELLYNTTLHGEQESNRINDTYQKNAGNTHSVWISPKYEIDENSFIDFQYMYSGNNEKTNLNNDFTVTGIETSRITSEGNSKNNNHDMLLRYGNKFNNDRLIEISAAYSIIDKERFRYEEEYTTRLEDMAYQNSIIKHDSDFESKVFSAVANYEFPIGKKFSAETGAEYSRIWNRSCNDYHIQDAVETKTSDHHAAAYFNIGSNFNKFYVQLGVRGEYLHKIGTDNKRIDEKPFSFLPTVRINYSISDKTYISLYYRRFTTHPTISERNPIIVYTNKYEYVSGNPDLKSSVTDQLALDFKLPYGFTVGSSLSYVKNDIIQVEDLYDKNSKATLLSYCNLNSHKTANVTISWSKSHDDIWFIDNYYTNINLGYRQTWGDIPFLDKMLSLNKPMYYASLSQTIYWNMGSNRASFSVKGGYNTSSDYLTASVDANWYLNSGLFLNIRKAGVKIGISGMNLLYNDYKEKTRYKNISSVNINRFPRRTLYISVSYSFNNHKSAFRRNRSNADAVSRAN